MRLLISTIALMSLVAVSIHFLTVLLTLASWQIAILSVAMAILLDKYFIEPFL